MLDCCHSLFPSQTKRGPKGVLLVFSRLDLTSVTARNQRRALVDGAVTIDAGNCGRIARLAVKHSVAVHVDVEMAITALHAVRQMHVFQVHRLGKFPRIAIIDLVVVEIEQVAFSVMFKNGAEDPAVTVIIGKLRVFKLRIEFCDAIEEISCRPKAARGGGFRINRSLILRARRRSDHAAASGT